MSTLKPQSNGPLYSNTFGTVRRGLGRLRPLLAVPNVTAHPSMASVPTAYYLMWHYNCLWAVKGSTVYRQKFHLCCWKNWPHTFAASVMPPLPLSRSCCKFASTAANAVCKSRPAAPPRGEANSDAELSSSLQRWTFNPHLRVAIIAATLFQLPDENKLRKWSKSNSRQ